MNDLISVIIPVYNTAALLPKCIDSVLAQTYSNIEIVLVNDGSTDNSGNVCDEYANKHDNINVIHKENGGVSDARNAALEIVNGDYITFVDSDDYIEPTMYEQMIAQSHKNSAEIVISACSFHMNDGHIERWFESGEIEVLSKENAVIDLLEDKKIQSYMCNKLYKATLFEGVRFPSATIMEDVCVNYQLFIKSNTVVFMQIPLYNYVHRQGSLSRAPSSTKNQDAFKVILDRYLKVEKDIPQIQKNNDFALIMWMVRTYTFIVRGKEENDDYFTQYLDLFKKVFDRSRAYITAKLEEDRLMIAYAMMWNCEKGKEVVKIVYGLK